MWRMKIDMDLVASSWAGQQHADEAEVKNGTITDREDARRFLERVLDIMGVPERAEK